MTKPTREQKRVQKMSIKYISFDLDDTFWDVMPTIYRAEDLTSSWIKENYPGADKIIQSTNMMDLRNKLLKEDPSLLVKISDLRTKMFYEVGLLAGYNKEESNKLSKNAFNIFIEARNDVKLFEGVRETLESLNQNYSLGVITNGNADLKKIGIDHLFSHIFSSANSGAHKPDPKAFEILIEASGLKPEEICHVGDHPLNDIKGSLDCGMQPIWFKNKDAEWPYKEIVVPRFEKWADFESVLNSAY
jgi:HAD superfamily hydrolase (TIGR01549 family)